MDLTIMGELRMLCLLPNDVNGQELQVPVRVLKNAAGLYELALAARDKERAKVAALREALETISQYDGCLPQCYGLLRGHWSQIREALAALDGEENPAVDLLNEMRADVVRGE